MFKKRPRAAPRGWSNKSRRPGSKQDPKYWRARLFRNTFTYKGHRFQVSHWSVKIQHRGTRKAFSLRAGDRARAAAEACRLYKTIVTRGWESVTAGANAKSAQSRSAPANAILRGENGFDASHWSPRLIHRKYTEKLHSHADRELSVRIDHGGTSHYFPLGTDRRVLAAHRAVRIYQTIAGHGWETANQRFPRELSIALRWADNPVAWTYTTIHTQTAIAPMPSVVAFNQSGARLKVAIAESDPGVRQALAWCINQQGGFCCVATFASAAQALRKIPRRPPHVVLLSQSLTDETGAVCLEKLNKLAPKVAGLLFSVYEDADQLFRSAPGGAPSYLFRRTPPTRILEPMAEAWERGTLSRQEIADSVQHYFEGAVASLPVGSAHELTNLTQREHEVLALLSKGQPDKEIAELLRISTWTVHGHLKNIFEKLGAHNRTEAVVKYLHK